VNVSPKWQAKVGGGERELNKMVVGMILKRNDDLERCRKQTSPLVGRAELEEQKTSRKPRGDIFSGEKSGNSAGQKEGRTANGGHHSTSPADL